jgi:hypothetical protein
MQFQLAKTIKRGEMMAATHSYKVYTDGGMYIASCKYPTYAAMIVTGIAGGTIRYGHQHIVWREGHEAQPAGESYDFVESTVNDRVTQLVEATQSLRLKKRVLPLRH